MHDHHRHTIARPSIELFWSDLLFPQLIMIIAVLFAAGYELRIPSAARIPLAQAAVMPLLVPAPSPTR